MAFGADLKRERELRGISLQEISKVTKISIRLLDAIEMDRYDILPEGIFRKSFIKSYARYLGMNEDKILQEYLLATQAASPPTGEERLGGRNSSLRLSDYVQWLIPALLVILVVGVIWWLLAGSGRQGQVRTVESVAKPPSASSPAQGQTSPMSSPFPSNLPASNADSPVTNSSGSQLKVLGELAKKPESPPAETQPQPSITPAAAPTGSLPGELTLDIYADKECWISVLSGDSRVYAGLLAPEETKHFSLLKPLKLTLGNAGGVKLSVNGRPFTSVGKPGEVQVLEINPDNYQHYLAVTQ